MALEATLGVTAGHSEMMDFVDHWIDQAERDLQNGEDRRRANPRIDRN